MKRAVLVVCVWLSTAGVFGSEIPIRKPDNRIVLSQKDGFLSMPFAFSVLEDGSLLLADGKERGIFLYRKDGTRLNSWQKLGPGPGEFSTTSWNDYEKPFFGLYDGGNGKLLLYRRVSENAFKWIRDIRAKQQFTLGIRIYGNRIYYDASTLVEGRRYCIYSTDLYGREEKYYLPAEIRYGLKEGDDWKKVEPEYVRAWGPQWPHICLYGDAIFSAWIGDSTIIRINIEDGKWTRIGEKPEHYKKPDLASAGRLIKRSDAEKEYSWTTGLFADKGVIGLLINIYDKSRAKWSLLLQTYSETGKALNAEILEGIVPPAEKLIRYCYCPRDGFLYVLNEEETQDDTDFVVYRYRIRK